MLARKKTCPDRHCRHRLSTEGPTRTLSRQASRRKEMSWQELSRLNWHAAEATRCCLRHGMRIFSLVLRQEMAGRAGPRIDAVQSMCKKRPLARHMRARSDIGGRQQATTSDDKQRRATTGPKAHGLVPQARISRHCGSTGRPGPTALRISTSGAAVPERQGGNSFPAASSSIIHRAAAGSIVPCVHRSTRTASHPALRAHRGCVASAFPAAFLP